MRKRKQAADGDESSDEGTEPEILDVDFEFFDPQPAVDFHGLKTLLRALFDADAPLFDLSALTDLILAQPLLGSTVKVDGNESDPYAFLSVLNMHEHRGAPAIATLRDYILRRSSSSPSLAATLPTLLSTSEEKHQVGLILAERLVNMPPAVAPPMYAMLLEELSWALEAGEPYAFTHYLILSRVYTEVASALDHDGGGNDDGGNDDAARPSKRKKGKKAQAGGAAEGTFDFHPEDEVWREHALGCATYDFERQGDEGAADARRVFQELGVRPQGHMILIEARRFEEAVKAVEKYVGASA